MKDGVKLGKVYAEGHTQLTVTYRGVEYLGWMEKCGNIVRFVEHIPDGATELLFEWGRMPPPRMNYTLCA